MWIYHYKIIPNNVILQQVSGSVGKEVAIDNISWLEEGFNIILQNIFLSKPGQMIRRKLL